MVRVWDSGVEYLESRTWLVEKFHLRIEWKFWKTSNVLKLRIPHRGTEGIGASVACTRLLIFGLRKWKGSEKFSWEAQEVRVDNLGVPPWACVWSKQRFWVKTPQPEIIFGGYFPAKTFFVVLSHRFGSWGAPIQLLKLCRLLVYFAGSRSW